MVPAYEPRCLTEKWLSVFSREKAGKKSFKFRNWFCGGHPPWSGEEIQKNLRKLLTNHRAMMYTLTCRSKGALLGSIAQLVERLPYKQDVTGSSPVVPTRARRTQCGVVVQLVRTPACHAGGRGFKSHPRRHRWAQPRLTCCYSSVGRAHPW